MVAYDLWALDQAGTIRVGIAVACSVFESVHKSNQLENDTKASGMST